MKIKKYSNEKNGASFSKKAMTYAAMTGAFLGVAESGDAQVVYTDVNPDRVVTSAGPDMYDYFPIDFDNDGIADIVIQHYIASNGTTKIAWAGTFSQTYSSGVPVMLANRLNLSPATVDTFSGRKYIYPSVFNNGDLISSGNPNMRSFSYAYPFKSHMTLNWISTGQYGQWLGVEGFMGYQFISGSNIYLGWIEMDVDSAASRVIVKGYAYESTPGASITAGDIGPVGIPEKNSVDGSYFMLSNNPASHTVPSAAFFTSDKQQEFKLEIINNLGEVVSSQTGNTVVGNNTKGLHLQNVAAGNYFVRLTLADKVQHRRLMIAEK
jgi:hypothetical protein